MPTGPFAFIFSTAIFLCTLYAMHMTLFATSLGLTIETAIGLFYLLVTCILCIPRIPFAESMNHIWRLLRLCFFPGTTISFSEVLFADALTSMSKVFKDLGVTLVAVYCYANGRNILDFHNHAMILIAVLASLPYWYVKGLFSCQKTFWLIFFMTLFKLIQLFHRLRVRQCTVQLSSCPDYIARIPVYLNILKYFSAFPPIWLTAYASLGYTMHDLPYITAYLAAINSIYSFLVSVCFVFVFVWRCCYMLSLSQCGVNVWNATYIVASFAYCITFHSFSLIFVLSSQWDVIMDWGLLQFTRDGRVLTRSRLLLPTLTYLLVTLLNLGLRFSWLINRVPGMCVVSLLACLLVSSQFVPFLLSMCGSVRGFRCDSYNVIARFFSSHSVTCISITTTIPPLLLLPRHGPVALECDCAYYWVRRSVPPSHVGRLPHWVGGKRRFFSCFVFVFLCVCDRRGSLVSIEGKLSGLFSWSNLRRHHFLYLFFGSRA